MDKKFFATSLLIVLTLVSYAAASYLLSPENLQYPNPGHYPGEIGPGTFNCSGNSNCFWSFPGALDAKNLTLHGNLHLNNGDVYLNNNDIYYMSWWWNPDLRSGIKVGDYNNTYFYNDGDWVAFLGKFAGAYGFFPGTPGYEPDRYLGTDWQWWRGASIENVHACTIDTISTYCPQRLIINRTTTIKGDLNVTGSTDLYGDINVHGNDLAGLKTLLADPNSDLTILTVGRKVNIVGDLNVTGEIIGGEGLSSCSECDSRFVNANGDTISGDLTVTGNTQLGDSSSDKTTVKGTLYTDSSSNYNIYIENSLFDRGPYRIGTDASGMIISNTAGQPIAKFEDDKDVILHDDLSVMGNTQLGDSDYDKTTVKGQLCLNGVCRSSWPSGGGISSCSDCDSRFVNADGDTMSGNLKITGDLDVSGKGTFKSSGIYAESDAYIIPAIRGRNSAAGTTGELATGYAGVFGYSDGGEYSGYFEGGKGVYIGGDLDVNGTISAQINEIVKAAVVGKNEKSDSEGRLGYSGVGVYGYVGCTDCFGSIGVYGEVESSESYAGYFKGGKGVKVEGDLNVSGKITGTGATLLGESALSITGNAVFDSNGVAVGKYLYFNPTRTFKNNDDWGLIAVYNRPDYPDMVFWITNGTHWKDPIRIDNNGVVTIGDSLYAWEDGAYIGGDLSVTGNTQLGDSSSDKTIVKGDLEVSGTILPLNPYVDCPYVLLANQGGWMRDGTWYSGNDVCKVEDKTLTCIKVYKYNPALDAWEIDPAINCSTPILKDFWLYSAPGTNNNYAFGLIACCK